jgi:hypothetical protein
MSDVVMTKADVPRSPLKRAGDFLCEHDRLIKIIACMALAIIGETILLCSLLGSSTIVTVCGLALWGSGLFGLVLTTLKKNMPHNQVTEDYQQLEDSTNHAQGVDNDQS